MYYQIFSKSIVQKLHLSSKKYYLLNIEKLSEPKLRCSKKNVNDNK